MARRFLQILPGDLRLPGSRRSGADPVKLVDQIRRFGDSTDGMLPVQVTACADNEFYINHGVTRATRIAKLNPSATITIEVIEDRPNWSLAKLPRVRETI